MEAIDQLLLKYGFVKKSKIDTDFNEIESLIGFNLPDDYKYYMNNYETFEGDIGEQYVLLYGNDELLVYNKLYETKDRLSNTVLIGGNGASEDIGIRATGQNNYQIVAAQYIHNIDDQIEIGISFTDMLERLDKGMGWFN